MFKCAEQLSSADLRDSEDWSAAGWRDRRTGSGRNCGGSARRRAVVQAPANETDGPTAIQQTQQPFRSKIHCSRGLRRPTG